MSDSRVAVGVPDRKRKGHASDAPPSLAAGTPTDAEDDTSPHAEMLPPSLAVLSARRADLPAAPTESNTWAQFPTAPDPAPVGTIGLGPLVLTVPSQPESVARVQAVLGRYIKGCREQSFGTRWYENRAVIGIDASMIAWTPRVKKWASDEVHVEVTQTACDRLGVASSIDLLRELRELGARASRIDAHLDDREGLTSPADVDAAIDSRNLHTRVRRSRCTAIKAGGLVETCYVGSRQSGRMLRVYNGNKLHGEGTGTRWELEHHGEHAERFAGLVAGAPYDELKTTLMESMRAHVDFVDRSDKGIHAERAPLLSWWAALVDGAQRLILRWPSQVETLNRKARWIEQAVAPTFALVFGYKGGAQRATFNARGNHWLRHLLMSGTTRLTPEKYDLLPQRVQTNLGMARWQAGPPTLAAGSLAAARS